MTPTSRWSTAVANCFITTDRAVASLPPASPWRWLLRARVEQPGNLHSPRVPIVRTPVRPVDGVEIVEEAFAVTDLTPPSPLPTPTTTTGGERPGA